VARQVAPGSRTAGGGGSRASAARAGGSVPAVDAASSSYSFPVANSISP
jgi:hypothetical protein